MNLRSNLLYALLAAAVFAYFAPWLVVSSGISLSLGAYDLAEWVSLMLPNRPLTTMLMLRLPAACLAVLVALIGGRRRWSYTWWLALAGVVIAAVALLPPFEFLTQRDDVNYRQQFLIAIATFIIGLVCLTRLVDQVRLLASITVAAGCVVFSLIGLSQAQTIMATLQLPVQPGFGSVVFILLLGALAALQLLPRKA